MSEYKEVRGIQIISEIKDEYNFLKVLFLIQSNKDAGIKLHNRFFAVEIVKRHIQCI